MTSNTPKSPEKDFTGLLEFAETLKQSGNTPPMPEGAVMEETPIEAIDSFESLEEYSAAHPAEELPSSALNSPQGESQSPDFLPPQEFSEESTQDSASETSLAHSESLTDFPVTESSAPTGFDFTPDPVDLVDPAASVAPALSASSPDLPETSDPAQVPVPVQVPASVLDLTPVPTPIPTPSTETLQAKVKRYSENLNAGKAAVPAAFPFSLLIQGHLSAQEKEKLLDLLTSEEMGFREMDLEPQFLAGKILLPRISEYAGVVIIQALRGTRAQMLLGPSDTIFSTEETRDESSTEISEAGARQDHQTSSIEVAEINHPAESLPIVTTSHVPGTSVCIPVDTITASASLSIQVVEAESSSEYQQIVEALQREVKYKAYRKGANAVIHFKIHLEHLSSPNHYRITATGTAVKTPPSTQMESRQTH